MINSINNEFTRSNTLNSENSDSKLLNKNHFLKVGRVKFKDNVKNE